MVWVKKISLLSLVLLAGCSSLSKQEEEMANLPVEQLYIDAKSQLNAGNLNKAATAFAEVERQHPYSNWAIKAQLMSSYCYYLVKKYEEAVEGFRTFIMLHPSHEHTPYAYYMIALCYYEQIPTTQRDQEDTRLSQMAFEDVINRFPSSPYAKDARFKIDFIQDHLAGKEMEIGRYYLTQKAYLSALNRFKIVSERYQHTSHITEALHRMVECYLAMGILDQAKKSAAVLGYNYVGSSWYQASYDLLKEKAPEMIAPNPKGEKGPSSSALKNINSKADYSPPLKK